MARRWEDELGNIKERISAEKDLERDVTSYLEDPVEEVQEFEYICENIEMEEEGGANNDGNKQQQQTYNKQCNNQLDNNERQMRQIITTTKQQ